MIAINSRRAVSLVELLVVMSACTVVISLTGGFLCRVMRIQVESRSRVDVERNALRLSDQFRRDVHQARSVEVRDTDARGGVFLRLQFADGKHAKYSRRQGTVLRQASGVRNQVSREEYVFPAACQLTIAEIGTPKRIVLMMASGPHDDVSGDDKPIALPVRVPVSLHVESLVGRDLRFALATMREEAAE